MYVTKHALVGKWLMTVVTHILEQMPSINKPQRKFLLALFATILSVRGRVKFRNLARYSTYSERTHHRQFQQPFDFASFNQRAIAQVTTAATTLLLAQDATFIRKSGKRTDGIDRFWNGCAHRNERGMELSAIAVLDVARRTAYPLSAQQTPPRPVSLKEPSSASSATPAMKSAPEETRMDFYLQHLSETRPYLPQQVRYAVFDGAFAKHKFVTGCRELDLHLVSLLRVDANLRYLYAGAQAGRGRPKAFDGKVNFADLSRLECAGEVEPQITL
jgi:hypothetical protein